MKSILHVDVFTATPLLGNPVAVVFDADDLDAGTMQAIARWTNLSETTFVCRPTDPGADYRLRIFTPGQELPFAGHPTLGSARAWLHQGNRPKQSGLLIQECGAGLIQIRVLGGKGLAFRAPTTHLEAVPLDVRQGIETALGAKFTHAPQIVTLGPRWLTGPMADAKAVLSLRPDFSALGKAYCSVGATGVNVFGEDGSKREIEVRSFAPNDGINEDPVCGSGNAAVAVYRRDVLGLSSSVPVRARQGRCVQRDGHVEHRYEADGVWLGGDSVVVTQGQWLS
jgi:PhzF family phenazine biosynthesis protein